MGGTATPPTAYPLPTICLPARYVRKYTHTITKLSTSAARFQRNSHKRPAPSGRKFWVWSNERGSGTNPLAQAQVGSRVLGGIWEGVMRELSVTIRKASQSARLGLILRSYDDDGQIPPHVSQIKPGGLAHRSSLVVGDLIVAVNDEPVHDHVTATRLMREAPELIKLLVHRDQGRAEFDAAAAEFEAVDAAFAASEPVGDEAAVVIPVLRNQLELTDAASTIEFHAKLRRSSGTPPPPPPAPAASSSTYTPHLSDGYYAPPGMQPQLAVPPSLVAPAPAPAPAEAAAAWPPVSPPPPPPRRRRGADDAQDSDDEGEEAPDAGGSPDDPRLNPDSRIVGVGESSTAASLPTPDPAALYAPLPKPDVPRPGPRVGGPTPPRQLVSADFIKWGSAASFPTASHPIGDLHDPLLNPDLPLPAARAAASATPAAVPAFAAAPASALSFPKPPPSPGLVPKQGSFHPALARAKSAALEVHSMQTERLRSPSPSLSPSP